MWGRPGDNTLSVALTVLLVPASMDKLFVDTLSDGPVCPDTPSSAPSVPSCARATPAGATAAPMTAKTAASANNAAPSPMGARTGFF